MSIRVMSWVWDNGPEDRGELLVLLALADYCDDAGTCYPSMAGIGEKARMTERGAQKVVQRLIERGYVEVQVGGGRGRKNLYRIVRKAASETPKPRTPNGEWETGNTENPERNDAKPRTAVHPNRQGTVIKEEGEEYARSGVKPVDEIAEAVLAFNAAAQRVGWGQVHKLTDQRRAKLRARLNDAGGLEGWHVALAKAEASDFCTGRATGWKASFDFLLQESSFVKLMEGNYDNRPDPSQGRRAAAPAGGGRPTSLASIAARNELRRRLGSDPGA